MTHHVLLVGFRCLQQTDKLSNCRLLLREIFRIFFFFWLILLINNQRRDNGEQRVGLQEKITD